MDSEEFVSFPTISKKSSELNIDKSNRFKGNKRYKTTSETNLISKHGEKRNKGRKTTTYDSDFEEDTSETERRKEHGRPKKKVSW